MKKIIALLLIQFVVFANFNTVYAGGGWTSGKGHGYFKLSEWWLVASKHYLLSGKTTPNVTIGIFNTNLYGEYGITDRLDAQIYFSFFNRTYHNKKEAGTGGLQAVASRVLNSVGDLDIGIKYGLIAGKKIVLSTHLMLGIPTGKSDYNVSDNQIALATGDGEFNQIIGLTASTAHSCGAVNIFASLGGEFNNRTNGFSDETRLKFDVGVVIKDKLILAYKLLSINSWNNGDDALNNGKGLFSNNIEYLNYTYEIAYSIAEKYGIAFSYGSVYSAKLILANPSYSVGVYYKF